ncbi:MAG: response regulator transcription factor [Treponema sp.]|jgi:DNA-binding NarL/FixJ family response regulator|nr:response regulator transcription factor [Treponema sp.]
MAFREDLKMISIVLADSQFVSLSQLVHNVSAAGDFSVLGQAKDGYELLRLVEKFKPDIVLLDYNLLFFNCFRAVSVLKRCSPETGVIILTDGEKRKMEYIFYHRIAGYISRDCNNGLLYNAIRTVYYGGWLISPHLAESNDAVPVEDETMEYSVSRTELEIMGRVAQGCSTREIADHLLLSVGTIRNYISAILQKIGLKDRTQMAIFALQHGLGGYKDELKGRPLAVNSALPLNSPRLY